MGMISISTEGSFHLRHHQITAATNGHAHAVTLAIQWLANEILPAAIEQDHKLHSEGKYPIYGFEEPRNNG